MRKLIFNEFKLQENEIDEIVTRIKVFLLNSKNEMLVAMSNGGIQLPGGHVEEGENNIDTIKREILEETGIIIDNKEILYPFFEIKYYTKDYNNSNKNRISKIIYYLVRTNKNKDIKKINLTENEIKYNFKVINIRLDKFEELLNEYIKNSSNQINNIIMEEMLIAYNELKNVLK